MIENYILIALIISFLWGVRPIMQKELLQKMNMVTIIVTTGIIYFLCQMLYGYFYKEIIYDEINKLNSRDMFFILFLSVSIFFTSILYYYILKDNNASIITALTYSSPVFTLLLSYFLLNDKIKIKQFVGIILIIIGIILISLSN